MILTTEEISQHKTEVGGKTLSLKRLQDAGYNVPIFIAVSTSTITQLIGANGNINEEKLVDLTKKITDTFPQERYAIRSSALIEDTAQHSFAGQFMTKIDQSPDQLSQAIREIITHAHHALNTLGKNLDQFSIIIQKYIIADYAGITFTRNPLGGRELVMEYHQGIGEDIVSGAVKPQKYAIYWNQSAEKILPNIDLALENFKKIEQFYGTPQDIEWCIKNNEWHILQSRPITTLPEKDYEQSLFLDDYVKNNFQNNTKFILEKTEISEIAPRPTPITLDILHRIYAENGPVQNVYKKYGITYTPHDFFEIVGNELYVNREQEIATLLPSYSYLTSGDYKPKFTHLRGAWTTLINMWHLQRIGLENPTKILEKLIDACKHDMSTIDAFMKNYELIFDINLLAQKALSKLEFSLKKESISPSAALTLKLENATPLDLPSGTIDTSSLQGNALEISDHTEFVATNSVAPVPSPSPASDWFTQLPSWKKNYLTPIIQSAIDYSTLREYGRWLTVAHISGIRKTISPPSALPHTYTFPSRLTDQYIADTRKLQGVSAGIATGIFTDIDHLKNSATTSVTSSNLILYTKTLSPDLTEYFPHIKGIISEQGGLLSHLAIMARESGIPVIVNVDLSKADFKLGDTITIDGSEGTIQKEER